MSKIKELRVIPDEVLVSKIYFIRSQKVMLDRDLALLYGVKPIRLGNKWNEISGAFRQILFFQLTEIEVEIMVSQNAIPSKKHLGGALPYVFTEHGVLMLANVLKSEFAIQVSVRIIELFEKLREMFINNTEMRLEVEQIKKKLHNQSQNIELVFQYLDELIENKENSKPRAAIGFKANPNK